MTSISRTTRRMLDSLPEGITVVAAVKTRTAGEILAALDGGVAHLGANYVHEAAARQQDLRDLDADRPAGAAPQWHMIGHLQRNKVNDAVRLFDVIQTVDSLRLARRIDSACERLGRIMPILIEVNSAREPQKSGVAPEEAAELIRQIAPLAWIEVRGLMTMGPAAAAEEIRPCFRRTRALFDEISGLGLPATQMEILSMGMSDSYRVAIEEGATMIRLGTALFGPRAG